LGQELLNVIELRLKLPESR
jgi:site-specific recombinase XerD